ncbi:MULTISPECIES: CPBP family intramembrane glutamic endopeptidase [unclassified Ruminococcus]|uniref:CPBP family intramembrane glutamic endopeptidase n=1 Tax=unclassified Ruminococcus TaxID=2608920 RepID=UPI002108B770|nr:MULTISPECIES: CPBP family glutamic-type intramembrane protease [unclassified Ruminococcus]MCQ4022505.1 CPBP family intramembrane metalloprotease [Ruminococcus sp. zg-924]MCQ4115152.1 CPBP family intramembrane metalloprotease [Ruminococcus sp. zg-921]
MVTNKNKYMIYLLPIRCVIFAFIFVIGATIVNQKLDDICNWWSIIASAVNVFIICILLLFTKKNKSSYRELINYRKGETKAKSIIGISLLIFVIGMAGMYVAGYICYGVIPYAAPMMIAPIPVWVAAINVVVLPVTTALAEDGLYLGCGVNQINNKFLAITVPAFFFALQHSFIPTLFDVKYIIYRFISFLPLTLILCWYYYKKRNPLPIMVGHALIDVITAMQILATSAIPGLYEMMCRM